MSRLRDLELDAPGLTRKQRARFRNQTRCIAALYERCLPQLRTQGVWKVIVECVEHVETGGVSDLDGIKAVQVRFAHRTFDKLSPDRKRRMALATLHKAALKVAAAEKWPRRPFEKARAGALAAGLRNEWYWRVSKASRDRRHRARVWCVHGMEDFSAWLVISNRDDEVVVRKRVIKVPPSEFAFVHLMGRLTWETRRTVVLRASKWFGAAVVGRATIPK